MCDITPAFARRAGTGTGPNRRTVLRALATSATALAPEAARGNVLQCVRGGAEPAGVTTPSLTHDLPTIDMRP